MTAVVVKWDDMHSALELCLGEDRQRPFLPLGKHFLSIAHYISRDLIPWHPDFSSHE